ncbi:MAG: tetratricopeptide repeat protein [Nannocystaceae bacterium]
MGKRHHPVPPGVDPEEAARIEQALIRLEERLYVAPPGLHRVGDPASAEAIAAAGLPPAAAMLWARVDGLEVGAEMSRILALAEIEGATARAEADGWLQPGDVVIGEDGRDLLVLPQDPWAEGADVVRIEEGGERLPEASTVAHLALGLLGEASVMFGDDGEYRDELFGEDGELTQAAHRRLLRRRLDCDPDAPRARLRLAQHLLAAGELRGAKGELEQVLRRAPELPWAHETQARVAIAQGSPERARRAYAKAAELVEPLEPAQAAYFRAQAARFAEGDEREALVQRVRSARPGFAREQVEAAEALLEREALPQAREVVELGLVVSPGQVELLALRGRLDGGADGSGTGV